MSIYIVFSLLVVAAIAAPVDESKTVVLRYENDNIGVDGYKFA